MSIFSREYHRDPQVALGSPLLTCNQHAQELGMVGMVLYSDPGDDGRFTEANGFEAYPHGPARNPSSVQRGSVLFLSKLAGDPYVDRLIDQRLLLKWILADLINLAPPLASRQSQACRGTRSIMYFHLFHLYHCRSPRLCQF